VSYATIADVRAHLARGASPVRTPEYVAKMLHTVPPAASVDRAGFILEWVKGQAVLELGASGPMHDALVKAAASCIGIDRQDGPGVIGFDLDDVAQAALPTGDAAIERIVAGEVLEHLANPGWLLTRLKRQFPGVPLLLTVPNAYSEAGRQHMARGVENVNRDHVAWYSYRTLRTLLERYDYRIAQFAWYTGPPFVAEGLIVVTE
jgi:hypothetical protein